MSEAVQALVSAITQGDAIGTEQAFGAAMAEKLGAHIDDMRMNVAQSMFAQVQPAMAEEAVEVPQEAE